MLHSLTKKPNPETWDCADIEWVKLSPKVWWSTCLMKPTVLIMRRQTCCRNCPKGRCSQLSGQKPCCGSWERDSSFYCRLPNIATCKENVCSYNFSSRKHASLWRKFLSIGRELKRPPVTWPIKAVRTHRSCETLSKHKLASSAHMPIKMFLLSWECMIEFLLFFHSNSTFFL